MPDLAHALAEEEAAWDQELPTGRGCGGDESCLRTPKLDPTAW